MLLPKPTSGRLRTFYTYHGYLSILIGNSSEAAESLANLRKGVEKWITSSAAPEMEAKRTGKDLTALLATDKGEEIMMEIRETLTNFQKVESGALRNALQLRDPRATDQDDGARDSVHLCRWPAHRFEQLQFRAGSSPTFETGGRRDTHQFNHRKHSRRYDHCR